MSWSLLAVMVSLLAEPLAGEAPVCPAGELWEQTAAVLPASAGRRVVREVMARRGETIADPTACEHSLRRLVRVVDSLELEDREQRHREVLRQLFATRTALGRDPVREWRKRNRALVAGVVTTSVLATGGLVITFVGLRVCTELGCLVAMAVGPSLTALAVPGVISTGVALSRHHIENPRHLQLGRGRVRLTAAGLRF